MSVNFLIKLIASQMDELIKGMLNVYVPLGMKIPGFEE